MLEAKINEERMSVQFAFSPQRKVLMRRRIGFRRNNDNNNNNNFNNKSNFRKNYSFNQ